MHDFLQAIASWGVAPFTVLLIAAILYWLMVIAGALDIDLIYLGDHGASHGDSPGGIHGDSHVDSDHHPGFLSGFLEFLSVGKVPLTVIVSLLVFIGWSIAMALALLLPGVFSWAWPLVFGGGLVGSIPLTAFLVRPMRKVFGALDSGVATGLSLLGREARITSVECTATFGTATCDVGDAEVLLRVVTSRPELLFHRDEVVVIADHDAENDRYVVGPATYLQSSIPSKTPLSQ